VQPLQRRPAFYSVEEAAVKRREESGCDILTAARRPTMSVTIQAHFDGKVIVPDEPVRLPVDRPLKLWLGEPDARPAPTLDEWQQALDSLMARGVHGVNLPDEALRREAIYGDRV